MNPLLYVLAYGAGFVAQGTPADMSGLADVIEQAIRFPGFAFVNVQSPCVTFGAAEAQLRQHKAEMRKLADLGHDPSDRMAAMELAQEYGRSLHTGVYFRDPAPRPTYDEAVQARRAATTSAAPSRRDVLDRFRPKA